jgi:hypothetical protein
MKRRGMMMKGKKGGKEEKDGRRRGCDLEEEGRERESQPLLGPRVLERIPSLLGPLYLWRAMPHVGHPQVIKGGERQEYGCDGNNANPGVWSRLSIPAMRKGWGGKKMGKDEEWGREDTMWGEKEWKGFCKVAEIATTTFGAIRVLERISLLQFWAHCGELYGTPTGNY